MRVSLFNSEVERLEVARGLPLNVGSIPAGNVYLANQLRRHE
jgi:hypothetical protein